MTTDLDLATVAPLVRPWVRALARGDQAGLLDAEARAGATRGLDAGELRFLAAAFLLAWGRSLAARRDGGPVRPLRPRGLTPGLERRLDEALDRWARGAL